VFLQLNPLSTVQEEEEVDDEDMGVAETYADYMPTKCECSFLFLPLTCLFILLFCASIQK
jgi:hypothetical protein